MKGPRLPDNYTELCQQAQTCPDPTRYGSWHVFTAIQRVYHALEEERTPSHAALRDLIDVLCTLDDQGAIDQANDAQLRKAVDRFCDYARTVILADIQQALPNPPHWAARHPDPLQVSRVKRDLVALLAFAAQGITPSR